MHAFHCGTWFNSRVPICGRLILVFDQVLLVLTHTSQHSTVTWWLKRAQAHIAVTSVVRLEPHILHGMWLDMNQERFLPSIQKRSSWRQYLLMPQNSWTLYRILPFLISSEYWVVVNSLTFIVMVGCFLRSFVAHLMLEECSFSRGHTGCCIWRKIFVIKKEK